MDKNFEKYIDDIHRIKEQLLDYIDHDKEVQWLVSGMDLDVIAKAINKFFKDYIKIAENIRSLDGDPPL